MTETIESLQATVETVATSLELAAERLTARKRHTVVELRIALDDALDAARAIVDALETALDDTDPDEYQDNDVHAPELGDRGDGVDLTDHPACAARMAKARRAVADADASWNAGINATVERWNAAVDDMRAESAVRYLNGKASK
jgi:hypothetical protein